MGRPKGSRNKVREIDISPKPYEAPHKEGAITELVRPPDFITMILTDEDLEPARKMKANHAKAAARYQREEIASELRRKEIGEIEELSVPQVQPFDLSAAFTKAAQQKARAAGYRFAHNLRKTPEGWAFEASKFPKVKNDAPPDQL